MGLLFSLCALCFPSACSVHLHYLVFVCDCTYLVHTLCSSGASAISEGDIFIYSCSAQLISFEIESTSKEINCAEHEYMIMSPSLIALAPLLTLCVCTIS